jgi:L,D-peptidoglycan transpeptidase YkuD (ErfK/YbiS/YcfS/YnhG family)
MIFTAYADGRFRIGPVETLCVLGKGGVRPAAEKREGDGATPLGTWKMRRLLYRPDKGPIPRTGLPSQATAPDDGWCDAPGDPAYNRPVKLPYAASHELMWRVDDVYDLVVVLAHNDDPVVPGMGSAIFMHLMQPDRRPTAGCVALTRADMEAVLALAGPGSAVEIRVG